MISIYSLYHSLYILYYIIDQYHNYIDIIYHFLFYRSTRAQLFRSRSAPALAAALRQGLCDFQRPGGREALRPPVHRGLRHVLVGRTELDVVPKSLSKPLKATWMEENA